MPRAARLGNRGCVSTLLEILAYASLQVFDHGWAVSVSTLLEILGRKNTRSANTSVRPATFQPSLRFWSVDQEVQPQNSKVVSTLLEILAAYRSSATGRADGT